MCRDLTLDTVELESAAYLFFATGLRAANEIRGVMNDLAHQLGQSVAAANLRSDGDEQPLAAHTEHVYTECPLRYFLLGCVQEAEIGGDTIVYDARMAADFILADATELSAVEIDYGSAAYGIHAIHPLILSRALTAGSRSVLVFRESVPTNRILNLPPGWTEDSFYSYMRTVLDRSMILSHAWKPGDVLIVDNYVSLHNRTPFAGPRWLVRMRVDLDAWRE